MTKKLLVWSILLGIHFSSFGQNFVLFQKNKHRQAYYRVGDLISVRVKGDKEKISGKIEAITDSSLVLPGIELLVAEITDLYVDEKTRQWFIFRYKYERALPIAGIGYLVADAINNGTIYKSTLLTSGLLVGTGILAKFLISKRLKIKGKRRMLIIRL